MDPAEFGSDFSAFLRAIAASATPEEAPFPALLRAHLGTDPRELPILAEHFPAFDQPNIQVGVDAWLAQPGRTGRVLGFGGRHRHYMGFGMSQLLAPAPRGLIAEDPPVVAPVDYVNLAVGRDRQLACVQFGLHLLRDGDRAVAMLIRGPDDHGQQLGVAVEILAATGEAGAAFLGELRELMRRHNVYRGQVLALGYPQDAGPMMFSGRIGVDFVAFPGVERDGIVLPEGVLERIEHHTIGFAAQQERLRRAGRHIKRGLLLHGPPGTGKTLTVMYLTQAMRGRTVVILAGGSLGLVGPAYDLARSLQPSMVVLEDIDLVAEERTHTPMGNPVLFELLNAMDGLVADADLISLLTTNRPDLLEPALAARPGRIDQAVEIPLPDADGRRRLLELYGRGLRLRLVEIDDVIARTEGVSAAFLRELVRKAALFAAEAAADEGELAVGDAEVRRALDELLVEGGRLTLRLLGGAGDERQPIEPGPNPFGIGQPASAVWRYDS